MTRQSCRYQRTICRPVEVRGIGFLTGADVAVRFVPALAGTGVVFVRTDLRGQPRIAAQVENITGSDRRTTLGHGSAQVSLVEHVMAALAGSRIDNCLVEMNAIEPPGLDGSAGAFVEALEAAGTRLQAPRRPVWIVQRSIVVSSGNATLAIHPGTTNDFLVTYFLDYGTTSPIVRQVHTQAITSSSFAQDLAYCRTFLLEAEAYELRRQGLGSRTTAGDLLVYGPRGPIDNAVRFANEPARHKMLDILGDLALLGVDLVGHVVACRSGHPQNAELARVLLGEMKAERAMERRAA